MQVLNSGTLIQDMGALTNISISRINHLLWNSFGWISAIDQVAALDEMIARFPAGIGFSLVGDVFHRCTSEEALRRTALMKAERKGESQSTHPKGATYASKGFRNLQEAGLLSPFKLAYMCVLVYSQGAQSLLWVALGNSCGPYLWIWPLPHSTCVPLVLDMCVSYTVGDQWNLINKTENKYFTGNSIISKDASILIYK